MRLIFEVTSEAFNGDDDARPEYSMILMTISITQKKRIEKNFVDETFDYLFFSMCLFVYLVLVCLSVCTVCVYSLFVCTSPFSIA